eukprot:8984744-Ditylum_brightwellii.AAC.1
MNNASWKLEKEQHAAINSSTVLSTFTWHRVQNSSMTFHLNMLLQDESFTHRGWSMCPQAW